MTDKRPDWAVAKVKMYWATLWMGIDDKDASGCVLKGVHFWDDWLLMAAIFFHNYFIAPFQTDTEGFPLKVLEEYEPMAPLVLR